MAYAFKWLMPPLLLFLVSVILHQRNPASRVADVIWTISAVWFLAGCFFVIVYAVTRARRRSAGGRGERHFPR